jgi:two-component system nitrogen regulation sensor histidine kinase NtrY
LAEGTQAVAKGNYDFQIKVIGDDEVAALVKSFNKMTIDLKTSRSDAENKRMLIEAILASLAVGVIALNKDGTISSVNSAAINMFNLRAFDNVINRRLQEVLDADTAKHLLTLASKATNKKDIENIESDLEIDVTILGARRRLYCTAGLVQDEEANDMGRVLIFDDITDLIQAQQMIAWREVARRIAHEIKNPLTPLQLCAQRLQKLVVNHKDNQPIIDSTETIVEHVASIKRLADEFAKFARMPSVKFLETDLDLLISSVISGYLDTNPEVVFKSIRDPKLKLIYADSEQLRRCFINLIDNAIFAMEQQSGDKEKSITIKASLSSSKADAVAIEIIDTGPGIKDSDKIRIFEPYFTTRTSGTGLGLAVVSSIIADHRGTIRVFDNHPNGARMVIELPVDPRSV